MVQPESEAREICGRKTIEIKMSEKCEGGVDESKNELCALVKRNFFFSPSTSICRWDTTRGIMAMTHFLCNFKV
jgi:hypothetical protein